jgi:hypothetical protein
VIEEGNIVLIFIVLFSESQTVESSTDAYEETMSIDDAQEAWTMFRLTIMLTSEM